MNVSRYLVRSGVDIGREKLPGREYVGKYLAAAKWSGEWCAMELHGGGMNCHRFEGESGQDVQSIQDDLRYAEFRTDLRGYVLIGTLVDGARLIVHDLGGIKVAGLRYGQRWLVLTKKISLSLSDAVNIGLVETARIGWWSFLDEQKNNGAIGVDLRLLSGYSVPDSDGATDEWESVID